MLRKTSNGTRMLIVIAVVVLCGAFNCARGSKPSSRPTPWPTPVPTSTPTLTLKPSQSPATPFPCASKGDVTPAILAAIAKGKTHSGGGCIRTQLIVQGTLKLGAGVYQVVEPILAKSGSSIIGEGWEKSILLESRAARQFTVIGAHNSTLKNGDTDSNITLRNLKIAGANPEFWSTAQAVSLGNCVGCTVDHLWLDRTRSIGIQLGGSGQLGHYAQNSKVVNCLITHVASQGIAVVNGENIDIIGNQVLRPGQAGGPGTTSIDLEVNNADDRLLNIRIVNNTIDHRKSEMSPTGNGIIANSGDTRKVGRILIDSNTIIGGDVDPPANYLSNGIMVFGIHMRGTVVTRNKITRTGQSGIWLQGADLICEDNLLDSVGGGGTAGFKAQVNNSRIRRNPLVCSAGPCDGRMIISGDNNQIESNQQWTPVRLPPGTVIP